MSHNRANIWKYRKNGMLQADQPTFPESIQTQTDDDAATICEIAKTTLKTHNYRVLTASNGIEALALYAQYKDKIDVVLTDTIRF
jgi:response regulator RpfG family c-di-GMP phosphodiesterase